MQTPNYSLKACMRLVKIITFKRLTVLVAWLLGCGLQLSAQENSPYSRYGLGDQVPQGNIINRAMGGVSTAYFDYRSINYSINFMNPASYSRLSATTFDLGVEVDTRTLREPNNPTKFTSTSTNISYVQLGIPLLPKRTWGINFGLKPATRINYKILNNERTAIDSIQTLYEGNGGSYDVFFGTGIAIKNLSLGFNAFYTFGSKDYSTRKSFANDSVLYYKSNHETQSTFGGFTFQGGLLYSIKMNKNTLRLGATGQFQRTMNATQDYKVETFDYDANNGTFRIDSVYSDLGRSGTITYPSNYSFGFMIDRDNEWAFGADYTVANWSNYQFFGVKESLQNSWTFKAGGQYTPDLLRGSNYWSKITYRAGFYFGKDYIAADGKLPVFGITAGAALPMRRNVYTNQATIINTAIEIGKRGNDQNKLRENFFRISLGLSLSDMWFIKRKYD